MPTQAGQFEKLSQFFTNAQTQALVDFVSTSLAPPKCDLANLSLTMANLAIPSSPVVNIVQRPLAANFTIDPKRNALVFYTISLTASLAASGTNFAQVDLFIDDNIVGTVQNSINLVLGLLSLGQTNTSQQVLIGFIPGGSNVYLNVSGSGTSSLQYGMEILL